MHSTLIQQLLHHSSASDLADLLQRSPLSLSTLRELHQALLPLHSKQPAQAVRLAQALYESTLQSSPSMAALGQWILGDLLLKDGQYLAANRLLAEALQSYSTQGETEEAARVGVSYITTQAFSGHLSEALQLASEVESTLTQSGKARRRNLRYLARLAMYVGLLHELMGNPEQALAVYELHLQNVVSLGDTQMLARINMERARVLAQLHAYEEAIAAYAQAEMLLHSLDNRVDLLKLYLDRNSLLIALRQFVEAEREQQIVKRLLSEIKGMEHAAGWLVLLQVQTSLAKQILPTPNQVEQLRLAQQSFALHGPLLDECLAWLLLGRCELVHAHCEEAQGCYEQVLTRSRLAGERTLEFRALHGLASIKQRQGETDEAILLLQLAIDKLELVRQGLQIETCRIAFLSENLDIYHDLTQLYLQQAAWDQVFESVERAKSRLVGEKLAARLQSEVIAAIHSTDSYVGQLAKRLQVALQQLQQVNQTVRLRQLGELALALHPDEVVATVTTLEHLIHTLILQIQYHQPRFSSLSNAQPISLDQLQETLDDSCFIQYFVNHQHYHALLIDRRGVYNHFELATVQSVAETQKVFFAAIERMLTVSEQLGFQRLWRRLPALLHDVEQQLQRLWQALFFPLQAHLPSAGRLILSPDSTLHSLPFHAFFDGSAYLLERYTISYVPSATVLDYCLQPATPGKGVLLCGYDDGRLAAVSKELHALAQLFPEAMIKLGKESTVATFLHYAPQQKIVHLSAHATFRSDRPMLSSIRLADRTLTLAEITQLTLCADLIGLSGCETGRSETLGSDLLSLASGFLGAGARSLLVSLWRVEDESTAQLIANFYRATRDGLRLDDALHHAQQTMLLTAREAQDSSAIFQHPAFWAPFVVIGNAKVSSKL